MKDSKDILKGVHLFKDLTDEEIAPIVKITRKQQFSEKQMIFMQGYPLTQVYFIVSGRVKIYRNDVSGKEQLVSIQQTGDMFPHVGFFRQGNYPAHAEAMENTAMLSISIEDFESLLINDRQLSIKLFRVLGDRIIDLQQRLEEMILRNTNERIILLLLRLGKTHGNKKDNHWVQLNARFTNTDLANMIGTSRESVNRLMSQLRKADLVDMSKGGFYMLETDGLQEELYKN